MLGQDFKAVATTLPAGLSNRAYFTLFWLCYFGSSRRGTLSVRVKQATIAERSGRGIRAIREGLRELVDAGVVEVDRTGRTNAITFLLGAPASSDPSDRREVAEQGGDFSPIARIGAVETRRSERDPLNALTGEESPLDTPESLPASLPAPASRLGRRPVPAAAEPDEPARTSDAAGGESEVERTARTARTRLIGSALRIPPLERQAWFDERMDRIDALEDLGDLDGLRVLAAEARLNLVPAGATT